MFALLGLAGGLLLSVALLPACGSPAAPASAAAHDEKSAQIEHEMLATLAAGAERGQNATPRSVECTKSRAFERVALIDDFHNCTVTWADGSTETSCILSRGDDAFHGSIPGTCEAAKASGWGQGPFPPQPPPPTAAEEEWALHAEAVCGPWAQRRIEAIGSLDEEKLREDFSYVWRVMRPLDAGIVRDLTAIPNPRGRAARALRLYARRLGLIDAGIAAFDRGRDGRGMALFDRVERGKLLLSKVLGEIRADTCSPP